MTRNSPRARKRPTLHAFGLVWGWPGGTVTIVTVSGGRGRDGGGAGLLVVLLEQEQDLELVRRVVELREVGHQGADHVGFAIGGDEDRVEGQVRVPECLDVLLGDRLGVLVARADHADHELEEHRSRGSPRRRRPRGSRPSRSAPGRTPPPCPPAPRWRRRSGRSRAPGGPSAPRRGATGRGSPRRGWCRRSNGRSPCGCPSRSSRRGAPGGRASTAMCSARCRSGRSAVATSTEPSSSRRIGIQSSSASRRASRWPRSARSMRVTVRSTNGHSHESESTR